MGYFKIKKILPLFLFFISPISVFGASYIIGSGFPDATFNNVWTATGSVCGYDIYVNNVDPTLNMSRALYYIGGNPACSSDWRIRYNQGDGFYYGGGGGTVPEGVMVGFYSGNGNVTAYIPPPPPPPQRLFSGGTTDGLVANVGTVGMDITTSAMPWLMLIAGIPLAFYIIQKLIGIMPKPAKETKKDRIIRDKEGKQVGIDVSNDGYHRITGKTGVIGWVKDTK